MCTLIGRFPAVRPQMSGQVTAKPEPRLALLAGIGFDPAVCARMSVQVGARCELGLTLSAGKRLFPCVHPTVAHKVAVVAEDPGAKLADKLLTARRRLVRQVAVQPLLSLEGGAAVWTHKPPLIRPTVGILTDGGIIIATCCVVVMTTTLVTMHSAYPAFFLMRGQRARAEEGLAALVAEEGLGAAVTAAVVGQRAGGLEGAGAVGAGVGARGLVQGQAVALQDLGLREGLAALRTQVGPLPAVRQQVHRQPLARVEGLVTVAALVGLDAGVQRPHVGRVLGVVGEGGPAHTALEGGVAPPVLLQLARVTAPQAAHAAQKGGERSVRGHVHAQQALSVKGGVARPAPVPPVRVAGQDALRAGRRDCVLLLAVEKQGLAGGVGLAAQLALVRLHSRVLRPHVTFELDVICEGR